VNAKAELYPRSFARNSLASGRGRCSKSRRNCGNRRNGSNSTSPCRQRVLPNNGLAAGEACKRVSIYPNTKRELQDTQPTSHVTHHKMYIPHSSRPNRVPVPHSLATCKMRCSIAAGLAAFNPRVTCALPLIPPKVFSYFFLYTVYRYDMERHFCWFEKQLTVHAPCTYCRKNPADRISGTLSRSSFPSKSHTNVPVSYISADAKGINIPSERTKVTLGLNMLQVLVS
jgi:hypothetical protein